MLLAAAIVPIATAYSIAEGVGEPASLDLDSRHFPWLYAVFIALTVAAVSIALIVACVGALAWSALGLSS